MQVWENHLICSHQYIYPMAQTKLNVLLIDDDHIFQFITCKALEATGYTDKIRVCANGEEAYKFLQANLNNSSELPDVNLLDINMPIMNGWEFLQAYESLRSCLNKSIQVFLVTSSMNEADRKYSLQFGVIHDYIVKPLMKEKLAEILDSVCVS